MKCRHSISAMLTWLLLVKIMQVSCRVIGAVNREKHDDALQNRVQTALRHTSGGGSVTWASLDLNPDVVFLVQQAPATVAPATAAPVPVATPATTAPVATTLPATTPAAATVPATTAPVATVA